MLAMIMILSLSTVVFADQTTTLTTTVPGATYTLNIPADQTITFGAEKSDIGNLTVSDATGFAVGKNLEVEMTYTDFSSEGISTTIPMTINAYYYHEGAAAGYDDYYCDLASGSKLIFDGNNKGGVNQTNAGNYGGSTGGLLKKLYCKVSSSNWGKALGGTYTSTMTFTSKVVAESN